MSGRSGFEVWRGLTLSGINYALDVGGEIADFYAEQQVIYLPKAGVMDARLAAMTYSRTRESARRDGQDSIFVEWARGSGDNVLETELGAVREGPGGIIVSDLGRPFVRRIKESNFISVRFDRSLFTEAEIEKLRSAPPRPARARLIGGLLTATAATPEVTRPEVLQAALASVVLATLADSADRAYEAAEVLGPLALDQARRFIDANLHREGLAMGSVVAATGVSRATLYRLFQPYGGLARYVWSRRLEGARRAICNPTERRPLVAIAEAYGFADGAHFTRAFKAEFGVKPSDLRAWS